MPSKKTAIVWFRNDLRLEDNEALQAAVTAGYGVLPVYVWAPEEEGAWPDGAASRVWRHHALLSLEDQLTKWGLKLVIRKGPSEPVLEQLIEESSASAVFWNCRYEPHILARDVALKRKFKNAGLDCASFPGALLVEPNQVMNLSGKPYKVFTAFWRSCMKLSFTEPCKVYWSGLEGAGNDLNSLSVADLDLLPDIAWHTSMEEAWDMTEAGAHALLKRFVEQGLGSYDHGRDRPAEHGTSRLSPYLHFGQITPRQVYALIAGQLEGGLEKNQYVAELGWREFAHYLLYHFPHTDQKPLREEFNAFPWREDADMLEAWQQGLTGYPLVDAGMRELWTTGWMHNRVRMVVASFLVKDLMLPWQAGAAWFWDTLVDADLPANSLGWQWTSGCGADAAPYFRIFNPMSQGQRFDPDGEYIARWVPELASLPKKYRHEPWEAPLEELRKVGLELGSDYPHRVVDHAQCRKEALAAYQAIKAS